MNSDFKELLEIFIEEKVEFLVVGGYAVIRYTEPRYTKDLDILIHATKENSKRVLYALKKFHAPLLNTLSEEDLQKPGVFFQMGLPPNRIDVITSISGVEFEEAYQAREMVKINGMQVPFIGREHLINAKLAAGRPQDLVDAAALAKSRGKKK